MILRNQFSKWAANKWVYPVQNSRNQLNGNRFSLLGKFWKFWNREKLVVFVFVFVGSFLNVTKFRALYRSYFNLKWLKPSEKILVRTKYIFRNEFGLFFLHNNWLLRNCAAFTLCMNSNETISLVFTISTNAIQCVWHSFTNQCLGWLSEVHSKMVGKDQNLLVPRRDSIHVKVDGCLLLVFV